MMFQRRNGRKKKTEINVVPLIDVLCFLIVFFMLFSTLKSNQTGMDINLPKAETVTATKDSQVVVSIDRDGRLSFEGRDMSKQAMQDEVRRSIADNPDTLVIIKADREVLYDKVIEAMDIVRKVGAYKLALAASREKILM
jgi:biopolymer transport protein ExbD